MDLLRPIWLYESPPVDHPHRPRWHQQTPCPPSVFQMQRWHSPGNRSTSDTAFPRPCTSLSCSQADDFKVVLLQKKNFFYCHKKEKINWLTAIYQTRRTKVIFIFILFIEMFLSIVSYSYSQPKTKLLGPKTTLTFTWIQGLVWRTPNNIIHILPLSVLHY